MEIKQAPIILYRPDIDGLRAISVLAVIIYHFFPEALRGGFAGVDVFFVISGYLVTNILFKSINEEKFSFFKFYSKRIRRLFPTLSLVLISSLIFGWYGLVAEELSMLGKHVWAGALFFQNIVLYSESGYFDIGIEKKPLLHLWSLSIEEQFYLFWPLLIYTLTLKDKRKFFKCVFFIIMLCSFLLSVVLSNKIPAFSFFIIPTRIWELAAGGALIFLQKDYIRNKLSSIFNFRVLEELFSLLGLILIIYSFFYLNKDVIYPGARALVPVLGTVLLIGLGQDSKINKILSSKWLVYIGLLSYPLYLWH